MKNNFPPSAGKTAYWLLSMLFVPAVMLSSCSDNDEDPKVAVSQVVVDPSSLTLDIGGQARISASVVPENATDQSIVWSSENPAIATVDAEGTVTAVSTGTVAITATAEQGLVTASCTVTVAPPFMVTVDIPAGKFLMGSPKDEPDRMWDETQHEVTLTKPFRMGIYEVTNSQYERFMNEVGIGADGIYAKGSYPDKTLIDLKYLYGIKWDEASKKWAVVEGFEQLPMVFVNWYGAMEFAAWIGGALPTEAEWEYACRAGSTTMYHFGNDVSQLGDYAWYAGNDTGKPHPVGEKKPNAWGLYDMHGNVCEWCRDSRSLWDDYGEASVTDPETSGNLICIRSSVFAHSADRHRTAFRSCQSADKTMGETGFRVIFYQ